jgi:phospholipase/carboxylesterase
MQPIGVCGEDIEHAYTVIFLHGLGDSAKGYKRIFKENKWKFPPWSRIVLPTAKLRPVTAKDGEKMNSWFDIYNLNMSGMNDVKSIRQSLNQEELR